MSPLRALHLHNCVMCVYIHRWAMTFVCTRLNGSLSETIFTMLSVLILCNVWLLRGLSGFISAIYMSNWVKSVTTCVGTKQSTHTAYMCVCRIKELFIVIHMSRWPFYVHMNEKDFITSAIPLETSKKACYYI